MWRRGSAGNLYDWITDLGLLQDLLIDELAEHPADVLVATHVLPMRPGLGAEEPAIAF
jgi:hypothetical protein